MNAAQLSGGGIKSIQRGTINIAGGLSSQSAPITAVDLAKTELRFLGYYTSDTSIVAAATIYFSSSTVITAQRSGTSANTLVSWELTERY